MSAELVCLFDRDFTLIRVSHAWPRVFGISEEDAVGLSFFSFVPDQQQNEIKLDLAMLGPDLRTASYTHAVGFLEHRTAWIEWNYRILLDEHGTISAYEAVGHLVSSNVT